MPVPVTVKDRLRRPRPLPFRLGLLPLLFALVIAVSGCGSAVALSGPLPLTFSGVDEKSLSDETIDKTESINSVTGNPYAAFLTIAKNNLGGKNPAAVVVEDLTLTLVSATGFQNMQDLLAGPVLIYIKDSKTKLELGRLLAPAGQGPQHVDVTADRTALVPINTTLVEGGDLKIELFSRTNPSRPKTFNATFRANVYFRALAD